MPDDSIDPLIPRFNGRPYSFASAAPTTTTHLAMDGSRIPLSKPKKVTWVVIASYVFDWAILIAAAAIGYIMGEVSPNKRPFSLQDPNIAFPFTEKETVPLFLLGVIVIVAPIIIIAIICLIFVPGSTVPKGTPKSLIWRRKLWELHAGWLGLALSGVATWLITSGMKNLFGKPRPDLLSRCDPDLANISKYIVGFVGGTNNASIAGQLVSAAICRTTDKHLLDDGFRSYPSGHASSSASGLIYLSLFIASKFAITIPFLTPVTQQAAGSAAAYAAFPSRMRMSTSNTGAESYEMHSRGQNGPSGVPVKPAARATLSVAALRRQAASPPLYLLFIAVLPFFTSVFIASSRWFDFRHHGFDILFGYLIGAICAFYAFYYYHLPIARGAGWAWAPRSHDKAFWAGVGSDSYASPHLRCQYRSGDEEEALEAVSSYDASGQGSGLQSNGGMGATTGRKPSSLDERDHPDTEYIGASNRI
ncbi:PAP2 superfamily domain containing protein [Rhypophila sp. PSN 637]